ncbi:Methyltransferase domain-containing protein [Fictibacillus solisalsi]|uniref:Methyltransferase domain-containing protein n=1 Tax=Fictibacillus solisalsi TaxID=459525 RepID=A0A1H0BR49_9BACL|nr:class I SAM-dependent methyltransferase [Fictibacillus solisalsi]SDN48067.1 Methyltransferase domain-containing protein [Fictibacillus solisalsi]
MEKWKTFFSSDYLTFSEEILTSERTDFEIEFILRQLNLKPGAKILDLGCGQGRLSIPLAQRGFTITGLDGAKDLLKEAKRRAEEYNVDIEFIHCDMREMSFIEEFDAVINFGTAFGYIESQKDDQMILEKVHQALKPNGLFIQDLENREAKVKNLSKQTWYHMNNKLVWSNRNFDYVSGRWNEVIKWYEDGAEKQSILNLRLYTSSEIIHMNENAGLALKDLFGFFDGQAYSAESPRMILKLQKNQR